jgi:hypothetical protein
MVDLLAIYINGTPHLAQFLFHGHGGLSLQEGHARFMPSHVYIISFVSGLPSGNLDPVIIMDKDSYAFKCVL